MFVRHFLSSWLPGRRTFLDCDGCARRVWRVHSIQRSDSPRHGRKVDRADRRGDDAARRPINFHAKARSNPSHLETASSETGAAQAHLGWIGEKLPALQQDPGWRLQDEEPVKRVHRPHGQHGDWVEIAQAHPLTGRRFFRKAVKCARTRNNRLLHLSAPFGRIGHTWPGSKRRATESIVVSPGRPDCGIAGGPPMAAFGRGGFIATCGFLCSTPGGSSRANKRR